MTGRTMKRAFAVSTVAAGLVLVSALAPRAQAAAPSHDTFYFIGEINKASIVMLAETGIVPRPLDLQDAQATLDRTFAALVSEAGSAR